MYHQVRNHVLLRPPGLEIPLQRGGEPQLGVVVDG